MTEDEELEAWAMWVYQNDRAYQFDMDQTRQMGYGRVEDSIKSLLKQVDAALDIRLRAQLKQVDVLVDLADVTLRNLSRRLYALEYFPHKEGTTND